MSHSLPEQIWGILICPHCRATLEEVDTGAYCASCDTNYLYNEAGQLDLHPQRDISLTHIKKVLLKTILDERIQLVSSLENPNPSVDLTSMGVPLRFDASLLSYFPRALSANSLVLDIGCGSAVHRSICEYAGFTYIGVDYASPQATILADAQALPFKDDAFDFAVSMAVIQYVQDPDALVAEASRVLKPGSVFIGSAAFLEPYDDTFYHLSHKAVFSILESNGFGVEYLAPNKDWHFLTATSWILFPKLPVRLAQLVVSPLLGLHRLWWWLGIQVSSDVNASEAFRRLATTGAIRFAARNKKDESLMVDPVSALLEKRSASAPPPIIAT